MLNSKVDRSITEVYFCSAHLIKKLPVFDPAPNSIKEEAVNWLHSRLDIDTLVLPDLYFYLVCRE